MIQWQEVTQDGRVTFIGICTARWQESVSITTLAYSHVSTENKIKQE